MKHTLFLFLFLALSFSHASAELGHVFAPLKPEDLAKIQAAMPHATVKPAHPRKLLVFYLTEGFVHASIPYANEAIKEMGEKTGAYTADFSQDMAVFTPDKLKPYDAIVFNNTTGLKFVDPAARQALLDYAKTGRGIVGIHSATDNFPTWPEGQALLGGKFDGHPWHAGDIEAVKVDDPANPILAPFDGKGFWVNDEIYQMKTPYDRNLVRVLLSLDMSKPQNARAAKLIHRTDNDFPICWIKQADGGRVFYCSLGHNPSVFSTPQFLQLYLNGIQYALGDLPADATPSGKLAPPPVAALPSDTPAPLNPKPAKPGVTPAASKAAAINGSVPPLVSMILASEIAAKTDSTDTDPDAESDATEAKPAKSDFQKPASTSKDPLGDGLKAISVYDYGADRTNIVAFDDYVRSVPSASRGKIEAVLLPLLNQSGISFAAKEYVCRWLAITGSDASVPVLRKSIDDPKLSHLAVYALLSMNTPAAKSALTGSLDGAPAALRPAIIGAIGRAGLAEEVLALTKILTVNDAAQVNAALDALGAIGSPGAMAALRKASVPAPLEATRQWALIQAAQHVLKTDPTATREVFASLIKPGTVSSLRVAAAQGYIQADPSGAWAVISPLLKDPDEKVRLNLAKQLGELPPGAISEVATQLPSLDPAVQAVILNTLAQTQRAGIEPVLKAGLASAQPEVHLAAISGYGTANLPDSASVLLPLLDKGGDESATATVALELLSQPDTSAALKADAAQAQGPTKAALLTVLLARMDHSALGLFFTSTGDKDAQVADIGFKGVGALADGNDLDRLAGLFPQIKTPSERKSLESALARCALIAPDKDAAAEKLLGAVPAAAPQDRPAFIMAVATMHSPKGTAGLQTLLQSSSVDDRKAVIRALSSAHDPAADKLLLYAASHGTEPSEKILALRGYLDSIRAQTLFDTEKVQSYVDAWPLATRSEEQQDILDAFKHMKSVRAQKALKKILATLPNPPAGSEPAAASAPPTT